MITKSVPTSDAEVELNVLSLLLDVPLASLDEQDLASSPVSMHSPRSPWSASPATLCIDSVRSEGGFRSPSPAPAVQRSRSMDYMYQDNADVNYQHPLSLEMHAAQTAVKAALDVLEEPCLVRGLRISTALTNPAAGGCLTAPLSPALSSPVSPVESCFSGTESEGIKKKGRARMSQEKRKRLARRREREAMVAALTTQQPLQLHPYQEQHYLSHSAPVTPTRSSFAGFPFSSSPAPSSVGLNYDGWSTPLSSPSHRYTSDSYVPCSPALTTTSIATSSGLGSIGTPASSPTALNPMFADASSSPPTLVVQPPSPQRIRTANHLPVRANSTGATAKPAAANWNSFMASVY